MLIERAAAYFQQLQDRIVAALEGLDGSTFREDRWTRSGGGGGRTRVLSEGQLFEKAGVNFSDVHGDFTREMAASLPGTGTAFRATGVSLVLHPRNPHVPTVHANFRRIQRGDAGWFGGGAALTPYYLWPEDAVHFHRTLKAACDASDPGFYPRFKEWCDRYFFLPHRNEPRGVGGLFFDYLGVGGEGGPGAPGGVVSGGPTVPVPVPYALSAAAPSPLESDPERLFDFVRQAGDAFLPAYLPIAERRRHEPWTEAQRRWQLVRRGRYVEFNLIYDRGTIFGLKTDGRVESILMSLPPEVRWEYGHEPAAGSPEAETLAAIRGRIDWASRGS
jgi:coproporphyrinogen III oxidase